MQQDAGRMGRQRSRSGAQGARLLCMVRALSSGGVRAALRFHAGNCPAFYWLLMCIFENIPLL